mmetsp:Transcript_44077/g.134186  ORF Transcript_44077/g.134186 Transcript_44077/m.134186 type:complete len:209 (-) Transcript_44077:134-760(-)
MEARHLEGCRRRSSGESAWSPQVGRWQTEPPLPQVLHDVQLDVDHVAVAPGMLHMRRSRQAVIRPAATLAVPVDPVEDAEASRPQCREDQLARVAVPHPGALSGVGRVPSVCAASSAARATDLHLAVGRRADVLLVRVGDGRDGPYAIQESVRGRRRRPGRRRWRWRERRLHISSAPVSVRGCGGRRPRRSRRRPRRLVSMPPYAPPQ